MLTIPKMNESDLFQLKENYVNKIIDGMDIDALCQFAYDALITTYEEYSEDQLKGEIIDFYDEETLTNLVEGN